MRNTNDSTFAPARRDRLVAHREEVAGCQVLRVMSRDQFDLQMHDSVLQGAESRLSKSRHALLATAFLLSRDWQDLVRRLRQNGFWMRDEGRTLSLCRMGSDVRQCTAEQLGFPQDKLRNRFGCAMPDDLEQRADESALA